MAAKPARAMPKPPTPDAADDAPLVRETLQEQLYDRLRSALMGGGFQPGESITIRALAQRFQTSTMPVREALRRLVSESSLEMQPNRTVRVPPLSGSRLVELCRIRGALESLAGELATAHLTKPDLERLDGLCDEMAEAVREADPERYLSVHRAFHFLVYEAAQSPLLVAMIENVWVQLGPYLNLLFDERGAAASPEIHHRQIVDALRARDAETAGRAFARDAQSAAEVLPGSERLPV